MPNGVHYKYLCFFLFLFFLLFHYHSMGRFHPHRVLLHLLSPDHPPHRTLRESCCRRDRDGDLGGRYHYDVVHALPHPDVLLI